MTLIAELDATQDPAVVVTLYDYGSDALPPHMVEPVFVDVTDIDPRPEPGFTYDGETFTPGITQDQAGNREGHKDVLSNALPVNDAFLAIEALTQADVEAQVIELTHQVSSLIRNTLGDYTSSPPAPPRAPSTGERRIDLVTPATGPTAGGTKITLSGAGFTNIGGVRFEGPGGTQWAWSFHVIDDQTMTCPTPPGIGTVDVIAFNGDPGDAVLEGGFTYTSSPVAPPPDEVPPEEPPPEVQHLPAEPPDEAPPDEVPPPAGRYIDSVDPAEGPEAGGTTITLSGNGFTGIGGVRFEGPSGTQWAWAFEVIDDQTMTAETPPGTGTVDVIVFNGDPGDAVLPGGFTYVP